MGQVKPRFSTSRQLRDSDAVQPKLCVQIDGMDWCSSAAILQIVNKACGRPYSKRTNFTLRLGPLMARSLWLGYTDSQLLRQRPGVLPRME